MQKHHIAESYGPGDGGACRPYRPPKRVSRDIVEAGGAVKCCWSRNTETAKGYLLAEDLVQELAFYV